MHNTYLPNAKKHANENKPVLRKLVLPLQQNFLFLSYNLFLLKVTKSNLNQLIIFFVILSFLIKCTVFTAAENTIKDKTSGQAYIKLYLPNFLPY